MIRVRLDHCSRVNGGAQLRFAEKRGAGQMPVAIGKSGIHYESRAQAVASVRDLEEMIAELARQIIVAKILIADPTLTTPSAHEGMLVTVDLTAANVVSVS